MPQEAIPFLAFHVEHVIARQHKEDDGLENLALACDRCNAFKGTNLVSVDPESDEVVTLFHPRRENWHAHFELDLLTGRIEGLSPSGRATVRLLQMNDVRRIELRQKWINFQHDW